MKRLILLLLLLPSLALAAARDVKSLSVDVDGWVLIITFDTMSTVGTWSTGLDANGAGTSKVRLAVTGTGYDDSFSLVSKVRNIVGTKCTRNQYPYATNYTWASGGDMVARYALSSPVYSGETIAAVIDSGLWTAGGNGNNAYSGSAVNNSTRAYPKAQIFWIDPIPWTLTSSTYELMVCAFQAEGTNMMPVHGVRFESTNTAAQYSVTNVLFQGYKQGTLNTSNFISGYRAIVSATPFNQGTLITNFAKAYPEFGDASSVAGGFDSTHTADRMYYGPRVIMCDRTGDYGAVYAIVDPVNGNNATATATTNRTEALNGSGWAKPFATWPVAVVAARGTNNNLFGRNNLNNCHVWFTNSTTCAVGGGFAGAVPQTVWCFTEPHPNAAADSVAVSTANSWDTAHGTMFCFQDLSFTGLTWGSIVDDYNTIWFNRCGVVSNAVASFSPATWTTNTFLTHSVFGRIRGGLQVFSGDLNRYSVEDCLFTNQLPASRPYIFVGNTVRPSDTTGKSQNAFWNDGQAVISPWLCAFNRLYRNDAGSGTYPVAFALGAPLTNGAVVAQNIIESCTTGIALDIDYNADNWKCTNSIVWNNTVVGGWCHPPFENYNNTAPQWVNSFSQLGNYFDAIEATFDNLDNTEKHTNRWEIMYGVGAGGNVAGNLGAGNYNVGVATSANGGTGPGGFFGLNSLYSDTATVPATWAGFVDHKGGRTGAEQAGAGDYHVKTDSPLFGISMPRSPLTWDLEGRRRYPTAPPGALATGDPRPGGMMFSQ